MPRTTSNRASFVWTIDPLIKLLFSVFLLLPSSVHSSPRLLFLPDFFVLASSTLQCKNLRQNAFSTRKTNSAAFYHGQVEQPVRGLMSLFQQKDIPVLIAINEKGIYVIDHVECVSERGKTQPFWFDRLLCSPPRWTPLRLFRVDIYLHTIWSPIIKWFVSPSLAFHRPGLCRRCCLDWNMKIYHGTLASHRMPMMIQSVCLVYLYRFVRVRAESESNARVVARKQKKNNFSRFRLRRPIAHSIPFSLRAEWCN